MASNPQCHCHPTQTPTTTCHCTICYTTTPYPSPPLPPPQPSLVHHHHLYASPQHHHPPKTHLHAPPHHHHNPNQYQQQEPIQETSLIHRISVLEVTLRRRNSHHFPQPTSLRDAAARVIQTHFRSYLIHRSITLRNLKDLAFIKSSLNKLKSYVSKKTHFDSNLISRESMNLLIKLDSIQATPRLSEDKVKQCVDPKLNEDYPPKAVAKLAAVAALCIQYEADFRPNMTIVVKALRPLVNAKPARAESQA